MFLLTEDILHKNTVYDHDCAVVMTLAYTSLLYNMLSLTTTLNINPVYYYYIWITVSHYMDIRIWLKRLRTGSACVDSYILKHISDKKDSFNQMLLWRAFVMLWSETCRIVFPVKVTRQVPERVWLRVLAWELSRMHFSRFSSVNQLWMTFEQSTVLSLALRQFDSHNCLSACVQLNKLPVKRYTN